jgi:hypothetical protein
MNGRVYDPFVARFLSGDPIIQDPTNGQNYDRYSYVFNNPTNFTDPTGFSCADGRDGMEACRGMSLSPQNFNDASTSASKAWQKEDAEKAAVRANASSSKAANSSGTQSGDVKNPGTGNSANREPTYSRAGFSSVSGQANDGSSVQVITDTWKRDSRTYGTPDQVMGQWFAFNPIEQIARDMGASQRQAFWIGVAGMMVGNPKQAVSSAATGIMNPSSIRFSQSSIKAAFSNGGSVEKMADALRSGTLAASEIPAIRLVEKDGVLFTLDNRRLEAFRRAGVNVPYRMATPDEIANEAWKFTTRNNGVSIRVRGE